jgi:uncharacterized protein YdaU (DUF1376 family)
MSKRPAFQFYAKDFLAGTAHMSCAEVGAYIRLLSHAWDSDPCGTIPVEEEQQRRLAGADIDEWQLIKKNVLAKFQEDERFKNRLVNLRLRITHEDADEHKDNMVNRAKKGAAARWQKKQHENPAVEEMDEE